VRDPSTSAEAIQERIKTIRDILKRPDPLPSHPSSPSSPLLENDTTDRELTPDDQLSLAEIQSDLRAWWNGVEEVAFHERLAKFKSAAGDGLLEADVYDFWIDEWSRKVKEIAKSSGKQ
jgi:hypothetical protein